MGTKDKMNFANWLTFTRIGLVPVLIGLFYIDSPLGAWIVTAVVSMACLTDYFDGYVARRWQQTSHLGRFLDPLADKLLISATLFMLAGKNNIQGVHLIPAVVIVCRELLISGLREYLAALSASMPVTKLAKWKTAFQMTALIALILENQVTIFITAHEIGLVALWTSAFLTLITAYYYVRANLQYF